MQFVDEYDKLAHHLFWRDLQKAHDGLETARLHIKNMATDMGLSAEGLATHLGFASNIGKLEEGEAIGTIAVQQSVEEPVASEPPVEAVSEPEAAETPDTGNDAESIEGNDGSANGGSTGAVSTSGGEADTSSKRVS